MRSVVVGIVLCLSLCSLPAAAASCTARCDVRPNGCLFCTFALWPAYDCYANCDFCQTFECPWGSNVSRGPELRLAGDYMVLSPADRSLRDGLANREGERPARGSSAAVEVSCVERLEGRT